MRLRSLWCLVTLLVVADSIPISPNTYGNFWQLTDMHLDFWYAAGSDVNTGCRNTTGSNARLAGPFGDYHCHTNERLLQSALQFMGSVEPHPDYLIWTGDDGPMNEGFPFPSKDLHMSQDLIFKTALNLTQSIKAVFPETLVIPSLGNHEVWPPSQFNGPAHASTQAVFRAMADMWAEAGWLPATAEALFRTVGVFDVLVAPRHRVVSFNTLWCDSGNMLAQTHLDGDGNKILFEWLEEVLSLAERNKERVWLTGHVPPTPSHSIPSCNKHYTELIRKYSHVISSQIYGHTHKDSFTVFTNSQGQPINTAFICPSLTPESWHEVGQNPSLRLYTFDKESTHVVDYVQYFVNLTKANEEGVITWERLYSPVQDYGLADLSPASLMDFAERVRTDDRLWNTVWGHYRSGHTEECDKKCRHKFYCGLAYSEHVSYDLCLLRK